MVDYDDKIRKMLTKKVKSILIIDMSVKSRYTQLL